MSSLLLNLNLEQISRYEISYELPTMGEAVGIRTDMTE